MEMDGVAPFLPQEIITNILKRLPVKSLIRFQCVCQHWKHLINTPSFMADHFLHSSSQNPLLLLQWDFRCDPLHLHMLDHEMRLLQVQPSPLVDSLWRSRIVGSSNGLLCVRVEDPDFVSPAYFLLWNPAIRQVRHVSIKDLDKYDHVGFGFSPIVNDFKIVISLDHEFDKEDNRVEVYSLSTGLWKEIKVGNFGGVCLYPEPVTVNGAVFWYGAKKEHNYHWMIVSFDIAMEVFTLIPMPAALNSNSRGRFTICVNKLALFSNSVCGYSESCLIDLWVMDEGIGVSGERWSWTKKYTIRPSSGYLCSYGIWGNEIVCHINYAPEAFFFETESEANNEVETLLSLFNLSTHKLENFATRRCGVWLSVTFNYVESLVPVGNIHIEQP